MIHSSRFIPLTIIPMLLSVILIFTSLRTGLIFYSDANAEYQGPLYNLVMIFDFVYLIMVTLSAIYESVHTKSRSAKKAYFSMITFVLFPFFQVSSTVLFRIHRQWRQASSLPF